MLQMGQEPGMHCEGVSANSGVLLAGMPCMNHKDFD